MSCYDCMYIVYIIMYVIKKLACEINKHQTVSLHFLCYLYFSITFVLHSVLLNTDTVLILEQATYLNHSDGRTTVV